MSTLVAPAKTPRVLIDRLNQEIVRYLHTPEAKEKFLSAGIEVVGSSPEPLETAMKAEIARLNELIKDIGIQRE